MTKRTKFYVVGLSAILLYGSPIMAQEATDATSEMQAGSQVTATLEATNKTQVTDSNGDIFYNHYVAEDELLTVSQSVEIIDTYTFEYNGRIYTNKLIQE